VDTQGRPLTQRPTPEQLSTLAPLSSLAPERLRELADASVIEHAARGSDPLAGRATDRQALFLLGGELLLMFRGGGTLVVVGGMGDGRHPLNRRAAPIARARAINDVKLLLVDDEALDIAVTFDQVAAGGAAAGSAMAQAVRSDAHLVSSVFSLARLRHGAFAQLPPARLEELFARFERVEARRGLVIVREGEDGDYYYVIEQGRCLVERAVGGVTMSLAELRSGDGFGEEALAANAKRNATVTMASDGHLLRLGKRDFHELLGEPLLQRVD